MAAPGVYLEQLTTENYLIAFFYMMSTIGIMLAIGAIACIDAGLVRERHMLTTIVQKVTVCFIGGAAFMVLGYGIWNWQYYEAFQVPSPLMAALKDWWLMGTAMQGQSQHLDPASYPHAEMYQVFSVFFFCFGSIAAVLIHGAGLERIKASAAYITSAVVGGIAVPIIAYLTYGSVSFLTNNGLHDFVGAYSLYMIVGTWSVILAWRLGPRHGGVALPGNATLLVLGVLLLLVAIPMFVTGCGFLIPNKGYFGPTMAETGLGLVFTNIFTAMAGGGLAGTLIAHWTGKPAYVLLGPVVGYVACSALYDVVTPIEAFAVASVGPFLLVLSERLLLVVGIDEPKVTPLTLLPSIYSALAAGILGGGVRQGGYIGITEGPFAFHRAEVSLWMQLVGVLVVVGISAAIALVTTYVIERTVGLRVDQKTEAEGMDAHAWVPRRSRALQAAAPVGRA